MHQRHGAASVEKEQVGAEERATSLFTVSCRTSESLSFSLLEKIDRARVAVTDELRRVYTVRHFIVAAIVSPAQCRCRLIKAQEVTLLTSTNRKIRDRVG